MNTIACGNKNTAQAAKEVMDKGGNAFDGMVAAGFASTVTEPMLTSLGGGGVGLLRFPSGKTRCIDFLTDYPRSNSHVDAVKKVVNFGDEKQVFYLGYGSLGAPGCLDGFLHIHKKYCTLDLSTLLAPSIRFAKGHKLDRLQAFVFQILNPFCMYTDESKEVFAPGGNILKTDEVIKNLKLASFLELLANDQDSAMQSFLEATATTLEGQMGALAPEDLERYQVFERDPISMDYGNYGLTLTPPPSAGGLLIAHGLKFLENKLTGLEHNSPEHIGILVDSMKYSNSKRTMEFFKGLLFEDGFWKKSLDRLGGTTHISILDSEGNAASITTSNGQGAGIMVKGTGIMLNNFAAEPDLMQYRDVYRPGKRITSMMSPSILSKNDKLVATLGSGGSNRIRSAILQVISNIIDFKMPPQQATDASRVHYEDGVLQVEPGISRKGLESYKTNFWTEKNLFFGGVHIAGNNGAGGDKRRGGAVIIN